MFLWVRLMLATLSDFHSAYDLEQAVDTMPSGLDEAYEETVRLSLACRLLTFASYGRLLQRMAKRSSREKGAQNLHDYGMGRLCQATTQSPRVD